MHKNHKGKILKEWLVIMQKTLIYLSFLEWCLLKTKKYKYYKKEIKYLYLKLLDFEK